jgi:hypothetical protein
VSVARRIEKIQHSFSIGAAQPALFYYLSMYAGSRRRIPWFSALKMLDA